MKSIKTMQTQTKIKGIKTVKNAIVYSEGDFILCRHYDTIIFKWNIQTKTPEIRKDCSMTSNRQIGFILSHYNLKWDQCINVNPLVKWAYSEAISV